jgi:probable HAF family extracellular repeat protein
MPRTSILVTALVGAVILPVGMSTPAVAAGPVTSLPGTNIGDLGSPDTAVYSINDRGQIAGDSSTPSGGGHAFRWDRGVMTDLGTLGAGGSSAFKINKGGNVIGVSGLDANGYEVHGFIWRHGVMTDLGTLTHGNPYIRDFSYAEDVNDRGQVVGETSTDTDYQTDAFIWQHGVMTDLGTLGGHGARVTDINDRGQVVGSDVTPDRQVHAVLWQDGKVIDLGPGEARAINNRGQIVGDTQADSNAPRYGVLWENGRTVRLSEQPSSATAINDEGQIAAGDESGMFLWQHGDLVRLGRQGLPWAINDRGQIVGETSAGPGLETAFAWDHGVFITLLPSAPAERSVARTINDRGQVAGNSFTRYTVMQGTLWQLPRRYGS